MILGKTGIAALLIPLVSTTTVWGQKYLLKYSIDKEHSAILFKIKNRDISYIYGRFRDVSGTISVDRKKDPKTLNITVEVKALSIDSNSKKRDRHIKGKDILDASKNKFIKFESKKSTKIEDGKFELTGDLTLMGQTKSITVVFEITGAKTIPGGKHRLGGATTFTIKRSDFGLANEIKGLDDEVTLIVSLEAELAARPAG